MKKKILSLLTAFAMVFGILVAPFTTASANNADEPVEVPTGKLDANDLSETKPPVTEIDLYKLVTKESYKKGAAWEHTGGKIAPDTGSKNKYESLGSKVEGLKGAKFTFYKINVKVNASTTDTTGKEAKTQAEADKLNEKYFNILKANPANFETADVMNQIMTKGYPVADGATKTIPAGVIEKATGTGLTDGETAETDDNGLATLKLADGYYWAVESQVPEKVTSKMAVPFGLTLPIMNIKDVKKGQDTIKAGTQYLKKLYIYPKNIQTDNVQIDKDHANYDETTGKWVDKDGNEVPSSKLGIKYDQYQRNKDTISKQLGQEAPYQSSTVLPRNYTFESFTWIDTMSEGLTYNKNLEVTIDYTDADGKTIKEKQPFINADNKATFVTERDNGYEIKVKKAQVANTLVEYLKRGPVTFHFSYSAKVNNSAAVDKPQSNSITFIPKEPKGVPEVESANGKIEIKKSWKKKGQDANPAAKDLTYYVEDANGKTVASVTVKSDATAGTVIQAANGITFKVGDNFGSGTFEGLPTGKFKVREAVNGYLPTYEIPGAVPGGDAQAPAGKLDIINDDNPDVKKPSEPKVFLHGKRFVKMDQTGDTTRLFGAVFAIRNKSKAANNKDKDKFLVVKANNQKIAEVQAVKDAKKNLDEKIDAYNKLTAEEQKKQKGTYDTAIDGLQKIYNDAVIAARTDYTWEEGTGTNKNTPPEGAYKLVSDGQGRFEITGLYAGDYELVELTAPVGYAKLDKPVAFTVKDGTYAGDKTKEVKYTVADDDSGDKKAEHGYGQRVDNKKVTIPQTGGIGSLIFIVAGLAIMTGAFVAYKKSQAVEA
ncbi:SpaA isopeptide-forming pilin-related protein [Anaerococcus lactolyticus]|uniref:Cell wall anchor protein n=1 Tax=Anaerococcus lactolyticus S7-1-13 TaxID=1284686 RepID=A0A095Y9Z5_9FIRM|nr:pilin N-terminal domain-containing protein [Anaerococcus lactolyticus]KGF03412.1 hypothetical protein HMPREF1630_07475 [Anaerococcus lactolyticus S7-1-13]